LAVKSLKSDTGETTLFPPSGITIPEEKFKMVGREQLDEESKSGGTYAD
jgi:hypothetical protein